MKVQTNASENGAFQLTALATVQVDLDVQPNNVLRVDPQASAPATVTIKNYSGKPVTLKDVQSSNPHFSVALSSMTIAPDGEVTVSGTLLPDAPKGVQSGWLKIGTDVKAVPMLPIRLWANVQ